VIPADRLPGGESCVLRVLASDGLLTGQAQSAPFAMSQRAPQVTITLPPAVEGGIRLLWGQHLNLMGSAWDAEDGALADTAISWTADDGSILATGSAATLYDLPVGTHTITLQATDSAGATGRASITVEVVESVQAASDMLLVAPGELIYTTGAGPIDHTLSVRNLGSGDLAWTAKSSAPWLRLSPATGTTPAEIDVDLDLATLPQGDRTATITIQAEAFTQAIQVTVLSGTGQETDYIWLPSIGRDSDGAAATKSQRSTPENAILLPRIER
jgi:hypothetical protein